MAYDSCECTHCVGVLAILPPQGCEAILIEILQHKRYCLLVKTPSRSQHSGEEKMTIKYVIMRYFTQNLHDKELLM